MNKENDHAQRPKSDAPEIVGTTDVRQGVTGRNVRYVLIISIVAAVIALAGITVMIAG